MTTAIETTIATRTEHEIPSSLLQKKVRVTVVGCGGTGSAIAAGLPYLHQAMVALGHPHGMSVTLVDGDRISRTRRAALRRWQCSLGCSDMGGFRTTAGL